MATDARLDRVQAHCWALPAVGLAHRLVPMLGPPWRACGHGRAPGLCVLV